MKHKDYTKFSDNTENNIQNNPVTPTEPEVQNDPEVITEPPVTPELPETQNDSVTPETPEVQNDSEKPEPKLGSIVGCAMLNMRKEPNKDAEVVTILSKSDSVQVHLDESTEDFYKVRIVGQEGYCVKEFIQII